MVTIVDFALRTNREGEDFYALILQGGIEMVKSKETERYYATSKKCSIPSTFDELTCQALIGEKIPRTIHRQECEPYEMTFKETGEVVELSHRWIYLPEGATLEDAIFEGNPQTAVFS